jgi:hypothetical protein
MSASHMGEKNGRFNKEHLFIYTKFFHLNLSYVLLSLIEQELLRY